MKHTTSLRIVKRINTTSLYLFNWIHLKHMIGDSVREVMVRVISRLLEHPAKDGVYTVLQQEVGPL